MPFRVTGLFALLLCVSSSPAFAQAVISRAVLDEASRGSVAVLIRLQTPTLPEGRLSGPSAIADQRRRIAIEQDRVGAAVGAAATRRRFRSIPWMAASVTSSELAILRGHPSVAAIHKDALMKPALAQSVPFIGAPGYWRVGYRGAGWTTVVLDTGVDSNHPMLRGRVVHEACYSTNDEVDQASSLCAGGASTGSGSGSAPPCPLNISGCNHGTVMAGVVAGRSTGLSGVAPDARLASIQVFSRIDSVMVCQGAAPCALSYTSDQVAGLEHVLEMAGPANEARIAAANLSLSGTLRTATCDAEDGMPAFKDAVDNLRAVGIATIVAAGNDGAVDALGEPACVSSVVSVGATLSDADALNGLTNRAAFLSLLAPGTGITSSVPGGGLGRFSGSSLSAAFVSGSWALMKQVMPKASVTTLLTALRSTGATVPDSTGQVYRRIRLVEAAIAATTGVLTPPGAPQSAHVTLDGSFATLDWKPPTAGNGPTRYVVIAGTAPGASDIGAFDVGLNETIAAMVGPGSYFVRVRADNPGGPGAISAEQSFTVQPPMPPGPPTTFASEVEITTVTLTWQAPIVGSAPTSYVIEAGTQSGASNVAVFDTASPSLKLIVNNAPPGTYFLRLRARNGAGVSAPSNEITVVVP